MKIFFNKNQSPSQMFGMVIVTDAGKVIAIDGGMREDGEYMKRRLLQNGGHAELWLITHPHRDHVGAFQYIQDNIDGVSCDMTVYRPVPNDFAKSAEDRGDVETFNSYVEKTTFHMHTPVIGEHYSVDNIDIEVLYTGDPTVDYDNSINSQSCIYKVSEINGGEVTFTLLIPGDLSKTCGEKSVELLGEKLKSDMIVMAHHGQNGAEEVFYRAVNPKYALWPTPDWLWTNTIDPAKPGQGPWTTLKTREWMKKIGTENINYIESSVLITVSGKNIKIEPTD